MTRPILALLFTSQQCWFSGCTLLKCMINGMREALCAPCPTFFLVLSGMTCELYARYLPFLFSRYTPRYATTLASP
jgi:hypothetical protein